jgi:hypothetical protein
MDQYASGSKRRDAAPDNAPGRQHFIYEIRFIMTGKCYIGQTINPRQRWWTHKSALMTNKHWCAELQQDWNTHGKISFQYNILQDGLFSKEMADAAEFGHILSRDCYNYLIARDETTGRLSPTDISRKKQSESLKRSWANPDSDLRNPIRTRWDDPEQRRIQSESQKRRYLNPEERKRTSEATKAGKAKRPTV